MGANGRPGALRGSRSWRYPAITKPPLHMQLMRTPSAQIFAAASAARAATARR